MGATHIQCGVVNHRINREPLDSETVNTTYEAMYDHIRGNGEGGTYTGSFYAGLITSVTGDQDASLNGPYYISYKDSSKSSYVASKLITEPELEEAVEEAVSEVSGITSYWGHL